MLFFFNFRCSLNNTNLVFDIGKRKHQKARPYSRIIQAGSHHTLYSLPKVMFCKGPLKKPINWSCDTLTLIETHLFKGHPDTSRYGYCTRFRCRKRVARKSVLVLIVLGFRFGEKNATFSLLSGIRGSRWIHVRKGIFSGIVTRPDCNPINLILVLIRWFIYWFRSAEPKVIKEWKPMAFQSWQAWVHGYSMCQTKSEENTDFIDSQPTVRRESRNIHDFW